MRRFFDAEVNVRVLGPEGACWYMLSVEQPLQVASMARSPWKTARLAGHGDDILEIAMDGLAERTCELFTGSSYAGLEGRELARAMTSLSGIGALLPGATVDDWAFEPCGYSMNALRKQFYYTVHVTPERAFSYASFETNDPRFREASAVQRVLDVFAPSAAVVTLTTRRVGASAPAYALDGYARVAADVQPLGDAASICCANFSAADTETSESSESEGEAVAEPVASELDADAMHRKAPASFDTPAAEVLVV